MLPTTPPHRSLVALLPVTDCSGGAAFHVEGAVNPLWSATCTLCFTACLLRCSGMRGSFIFDICCCLCWRVIEACVKINWVRSQLLNELREVPGRRVVVSLVRLLLLKNKNEIYIDAKRWNGNTRCASKNLAPGMFWVCSSWRWVVGLSLLVTVYPLKGTAQMAIQMYRKRQPAPSPSAGA